MKKLRLILLAITIALPIMALGSSFYQEAPKVKSTTTSSKPIIINYKGKLVAEKYRHVVKTIVLDCPQGVVQFTTMEWLHKGQVSATFTSSGNTSTLRGTLNKDSNSFEGHVKEGQYFILHLKGVIKEDSAEGSVWFEIHNLPQYNANGICIANFTAYPSR
jgi:hypothetical protein|tara:strand:- start:289 stop:771 length:483 start_codon:yes stop_codon:yes gene_type:complete